MKLKEKIMRTHLPHPRLWALLAFACLVCACSSAPRLETRWLDPVIGPQSHFLRGEKILVACDAYDATVRQICNDTLSREIRSQGAVPLNVPPTVVLLTDREFDAQLIGTATSLGAKAVFAMTLSPSSTDAGSGLSIGIGGFGLGRNSGAGIGLSAPIGSGRFDTGFTANGRVTDSRTARLVWTATASATPSSDVAAQIANLSGVIVQEAKVAGLFD